MRKLLPCGYPPISTQDELVQRTLPWSFLLPAHEREVVGYYNNYMKFFDENRSNEDDKLRSSFFETDLNCRHSRELSKSLNKTAEEGKQVRRRK